MTVLIKDHLLFFAATGTLIQKITLVQLTFCTSLKFALKLLVSGFVQMSFRAMMTPSPLTWRLHPALSISCISKCLLLRALAALGSSRFQILIICKHVQRRQLVNAQGQLILGSFPRVC